MKVIIGKPEATNEPLLFDEEEIKGPHYLGESLYQHGPSPVLNIRQGVTASQLSKHTRAFVAWFFRTDIGKINDSDKLIDIENDYWERAGFQRDESEYEPVMQSDGYFSVSVDGWAAALCNDDLTASMGITLIQSRRITSEALNVMVQLGCSSEDIDEVKKLGVSPILNGSKRKRRLDDILGNRTMELYGSGEMDEGEILNAFAPLHEVLEIANEYSKAADQILYLSNVRNLIAGYKTLLELKGLLDR